MSGAFQKQGFVLSPEEKKVYGNLFKQLDPEGFGIVTGDKARSLLERSGLPAEVLGEIWQYADKDNNGFLDQIGFSQALRMIGQVQSGKPISPSLADSAGPIPSFDGKPVVSPVQPQYSGQSQTPAGLAGPVAAAASLPPLTPQECARFVGLFEKSAPNGILEGDQARMIFLKARLPNEVLGQIWALADTRARGKLDQTEFVIAMHLVQCVLSGAIKDVPLQLPRSLYESAQNGGRPSSRSSFAAQQRIPSTSSQVSRQYTGQYRQASPALRPGHTGPVHSQQASISSTNGDWSIPPSDRARFDGIFESLDKLKQGTIGAAEVVPLLTTSKLSESDLAQVWDLSDIHNTGNFGKKEFAIAMYLVYQRMSGRELPPVLPASLLADPPQQGIPTASASAPAPALASANVFEAPLQQPHPQQPQAPPSRAPAERPPMVSAPSSSINDLFDLNEAFSSPPPAQAAPTKSLADTKKFVPTSQFGQSLEKDVTGQSINSPPIAQPKPISVPSSYARDLLSEEPQATRTAAPSAAATSAANMELANLSNQISSLTTQTVGLTEQRQNHERELQASQQISADIKKKLVSLRATYDEEVKKVREIELQLDASRKEQQKMQQDYSIIEASYNALRGTHQEVASALAASQQDIAATRDRMKQIQDATLQLQESVDKLTKETHHHKNLADVNRKQLDVLETEHKRNQDAAEAAQYEREQAIREAEESERALQAHQEKVKEFSASAMGAAAASGAIAGSIVGAVVGADASAPQTSQAAISSPSSVQSSGNPFYNNFAISTADSLTETTADATRRSSATEVTAASPPHINEFQYHEQGGVPAQFTLPLARPESTTSSVQNNPPASVRGDLDVTSRPYSQDFDDSAVSEPSEGTTDLPRPAEDSQSDTKKTEFSAPKGTGSASSFEMVEHDPQVANGTNLSSSVLTTGTATEDDRQNAVKDVSSTLPSDSVTTLSPEQLASTVSASVPPVPPLPAEVVPEVPLKDERRETQFSFSDHTLQSKELPSIPSNSLDASVPGAWASPIPPAQEPTSLDVDESSSDDDEGPEEIGRPNKYKTKTVPLSSNGEESDGFASAPSSPQVKSDTHDSTSEIPPSVPAPATSFSPDKADKNQPTSASETAQFGPSATSAGLPTTTADSHLPESREQRSLSFESHSVEMVSPFDKQADKKEDKSVAPHDQGYFADATSNGQSHATTSQQTSAPITATAISAPANASASTVAPLSVSNDFDPFAAEFDNLAEAKEEPAGADDAFDDFEASFENAFPSVATASNNGPPLPPQEPLSNKSTGIAAPANGSGDDEWEQIFAGFSSGNTGEAAKVAVNRAQSLSPHSQAVADLQAMGFDREAALQALKTNNYNLDQATNYLLDKTK